MQDRYTLREAATFLGLDYEKLKTDARRGKFPFFDEVAGKQKRRYITPETLLALKNQTIDQDYQRLFDQYLAELRAGTIAKKPCADSYIEITCVGERKFWVICGLTPAIRHINADTLRGVFAKIGVDDARRLDHFSTKRKVANFATGFMRLLVREGFKTHEDLRLIREVRPARKYKKTPESFTPAQINDLINFNLNWTHGRRAHSRYSMDIFLHLYCFVGIRKMEAAQLTLGDIDLTNSRIRIWGKGGKRRFVPLHARIRQSLAVWMADYRSKLPMENPLLLVTHEGKPYSADAIKDKFTRLSDAWRQHVHPHKLRRSCATVLAHEGMPVSLIQHLLGHSQITTTQGYIDSRDQDLFDYMMRPALPSPTQTGEPGTDKAYKPMI